MIRSNFIFRKEYFVLGAVLAMLMTSGFHRKMTKHIYE
jgi:hypothetical protein